MDVYLEICDKIRIYKTKNKIVPNILYISKDAYINLTRYGENTEDDTFIFSEVDGRKVLIGVRGLSIQIVEDEECICVDYNAAIGYKYVNLNHKDTYKSLNEEVDSNELDKKLNDTLKKIEGLNEIAKKRKLIDKLMFTKLEMIDLLPDDNDKVYEDMDQSLKYLHNEVLFYEYLVSNGYIKEGDEL